MKKFLLTIVLILCFLTAGGFAVLNSGNLSAKIVPALAVRYLNIPVTDVRIDKQQFGLDGRLRLDGVDFKFPAQDGIFTVSFDRLGINFKGLFFKDNAKVSMDLEKLDIDAATLNLSGAVITTDVLKNGRIENGYIQAPALKYLGYKFENITAQVFSTPAGLKADGIRADFYGGKIEAEIVMEISDPFVYSVNAGFNNIDITKLQEANSAVFSNAKGIVNGNIEAEFGGSGDFNLKGKVFSVSGMEMKAVLLKPLLEYIPQSRQKKDLEQLFQQQGNIPLETAAITLLGVTDKTLKTYTKLESRKFNLDVGLNLDFNIEGGIQNLLNLQKQFFLNKR